MCCGDLYHTFTLCIGVLFIRLEFVFMVLWTSEIGRENHYIKSNNSHVKYSLNLKYYKSAVFSLFVLAGATTKLCLCSNLFNFGVPPFDTLDSSFRRRYEPNLVQQAPMIYFIFKIKKLENGLSLHALWSPPQSVLFLPLTA